MRFSVILASLVGFLACTSGGENATPGTGVGGGIGTAAGGTREGAATGGGTVSNSQGGNASGGTTSIGSRLGSGGSIGQGGWTNAGGTNAGGTNAGGTNAPGTTSIGGITGIGGKATSGSNLPIGGAAPNGGSNATGGRAPMGGTLAIGGSTATGGNLPIGGTTSAGGSIATGGSTGSALQAISAIDAATAMGKGVNLGQTFESTQNDRTLAAVSAKIDAYYAKGFRNVRIPITWTEPVGGDLLVGSATVGDVNRTHARLSVIKQVVEYALSKSGLYVVINAHHESGLKTNSRASVLERLWADISEIFAATDHRLLFEILNEPHRSDSSNSAMPAADLRSMVRMAYAKIRAVDAARIVIIGGNQWFASSEMASVWPDLTGVGNGQDPYLMATFHHYDPWTFCGDNQGTYDDPWTDSNLSTPMETMLSWAKSVGHSMPVYIGEWGVGWASRSNTMDCNNIRSWYQKMVATATSKGIPTSLWDDNGWFKVWDIGAKSWNNNLVECILGTCSWNGTDRYNAGCK